MADKPEAEIIEVVEEVLDNQTFLLAVVGGVVVGAILLYGWQEYQKNQGGVRIVRTAPHLVEAEPEPLPGFAEGE